SSIAAAMQVWIPSDPCGDGHVCGDAHVHPVRTCAIVAAMQLQTRAVGQEPLSAAVGQIPRY
ncbi:MAG: hypothetical protein ACPIOQ_35565, partial [Promethearchaeia archaeon]